METDIPQSNDFMMMLLLDLLLFIILLILFYFLYKLYLHVIRYPEKSS